MRVIVTGGAGFIGSHFIWQLLAEVSDCQIVCIDRLTYAADITVLEDLPCNRFKFVKMDICDPAISKIVEDADYVFNFAAESHVDNSIANADPFIQTNVNGTHNLLRCMVEAKKLRESIHRPQGRFVQVSTDEVYGSLPEGFASEDSLLRPSSPYSASKASADLLVRAYAKTHGLDTVITRSTNNYGPRQNAEKFIPNVISRIMKGEEVVIYDQGRNVRDWIYVTDNCRGIWVAASRGESGEVYNIGMGQRVREYSNIDIYNMISGHMDGRWKLPGCRYVRNARPGHDFRYAVDATKIQQLGWQPIVLFNYGLYETIEWYCKNYSPVASGTSSPS